jgi:hypothetical protein
MYPCLIKKGKQVENVDIVELKEDLALLAARLNTLTHKRVTLERLNYNPLFPIILIPERFIKIAKNKEQKMTEDYLCLEQLISELEIHNHVVLKVIEI